MDRGHCLVSNLPVAHPRHDCRRLRAEVLACSDVGLSLTMMAQLNGFVVSSTFHFPGPAEPLNRDAGGAGICVGIWATAFARCSKESRRTVSMFRPAQPANAFLISSSWLRAVSGKDHRSAATKGASHCVNPPRPHRIESTQLTIEQVRTQR